MTYKTPLYTKNKKVKNNKKADEDNMISRTLHFLCLDSTGTSGGLGVG